MKRSEMTAGAVQLTVTVALVQKFYLEKFEILFLYNLTGDIHVTCNVTYYQLVHISPLLFLICFAVPSFMHLTSEQFEISIAAKINIQYNIIVFLILPFNIWPPERPC